MGITRGLTDMVGRAGDVDDADLEERVDQAVFGFLKRKTGIACRWKTQQTRSARNRNAASRLRAAALHELVVTTHRRMS